jgi:hypothetical protein
MGANWSNPLSTSEYLDLLADLKARDVDAMTMMYSLTGVSNIPTNAIRHNPDTGRLERHIGGGSWVDLGYVAGITNQAAGDLVAKSSSTGWERIPSATAGYVLKANGVGSAPSFQAIGTVPNATLAAACTNTVVAGSGIGVSGSLSSGNVTVAITPLGVGATQLGEGSVTRAKLEPYSIGVYCEIMLLRQETAFSWASWQELFYRIMPRSGSVRVQWEMRAGTYARSANTRVYINTAPAGTAWSTGETYYQTYYDDVYVYPGDRLSLYGWAASGHTVNVRNFGVLVNKPSCPTIAWTDMVNGAI